MIEEHEHTPARDIIDLQLRRSCNIQMEIDLHEVRGRVGAELRKVTWGACVRWSWATRSGLRELKDAAISPAGKIEFPLHISAEG